LCFELRSVEEKITCIEIQKDISLLFMIEDINDLFIVSALSTFLDSFNFDLVKIHKEKLIEFSDKLKKENFDGWFSSIDNKIT